MSNNKQTPDMNAEENKSAYEQVVPVRRQVFGISIHPLVLILGALMVVFIIASFVNNSNPNHPISVDEFMRGIKQNQYSGIVIQDTGEILAQDKYVISADIPTGKEIDASSVVKLKEQTVESLIAILRPQDPLAQLRGVVTGAGSAKVGEIFIGTDFVIIHKVSGNEDEIIRDISEEEFTSALSDAGLSIDQLGITLSYLRSANERVEFESFLSRSENKQFSYVYQLDNQVYGRMRDSAITTYSITWDGGIRSFATALQQEGISLASPNLRIGSIVVATIPWGDIISILTLIGFVILGIFLFRGIQSSGNSLVRFGQSKARMFWGVKPDVTFKDVAGIDEAKEELNEIVQFLREPGRFRKLGARIPKGVLMVGSPGTGKTLLARAIAGEAGVPFFHTSGSEFEEMLVGAGASRVRDLFDKAKKSAPSLIFIDEIDAVARKRGTTIQSSTTEQTLNQILVEMDGFEQNTNVIVIAATNRPDVLDPAILRPGRFDRRVVLDLPDMEGRKQILGIHAENKPLAADVNLERVAKRTIGFSGAELENTLNEAAIIAAKHDRKEITAADIEEAATKVTMGPAKMSRNRTPEELKLVAVHEAGHAIVSRYVPQADPVHRVSIISRGMAGGVTHFLPQDDNRIMSRQRLMSRVIVALGGRAAEEVALDDISTGASSDIDSATNIIRSMVQKYGMSEKLGLIKYGESNDLQYLGYGYGEQRDYSDDTARLIDEEVRRMVQEAYNEAVKILNDNRGKLDKLVQLLLEKEVIEAEEFELLF
jgi:cell division protease FtsH